MPLFYYRIGAFFLKRIFLISISIAILLYLPAAEMKVS